MRKLHLLTYPAVALLSLVATGAALADDITPDDTATQVFAETKTRAQVQAELAAARADGSIKAWSIGYNPLAMARSTATRAEVQSPHCAPTALRTTPPPGTAKTAARSRSAACRPRAWPRRCMPARC